jgi:hypothetical protein
MNAQSIHHACRAALLGLLLTVLAGCGGGGDGGVVAGGGIGGTGISSGTVTGIGSVWVNGARYLTDGATLVRNGDDTVQLGDFRVGDVVLVEWAQADGSSERTASRVTYEAELIGEVTSDPIPAADPLKRSFGVMGQTVIMGAETVFDDFAQPAPAGEFYPADLISGACVEVTGFRRTDGAVLATRVELEPGCTGSVELKGFIESVSGNDIVVAGADVNVASATIEPAGTPLAAGQYVEVEGSFAPGPVQVNATRVEVKDVALSDDEDALAEIEGLVSNLQAGPPVTFSVSGVAVVTTDSTTVEGGLLAGLADDLRVEVEGRFNAGGQLVASSIQLRPDSQIELEADVLSVDTVAGTLDLAFGADFVRVTIDSLTQFKDTTGTFATFGMADIDPSNHHLEVVGYLDGATLVATRVELEELTPDSERKLKGPVDAGIADPVFTVLGIPVDSTGWVDDDFDPATRSAFFLALSPGDIVEVEDGVDTGAMDWSDASAEIEFDLP